MGDEPVSVASKNFFRKKKGIEDSLHCELPFGDPLQSVKSKQN